MVQVKPKPKYRRRSTVVYDTPSGLGGTHTVAIVEDRGDKALVSVCYGCFRNGGDVWESWPDFDGARFTVDKSKLTNKGTLGEPARERRQRAEPCT